MPTRSGLDFALKDRLAETEVMEGDGTNERELGTETDAHAVERGATRKLSRATGSDEERKLPRGAEKEGTKGGVEKPVSEEAATTTKGRRGSGRPYPRSASWQGFEEEAASMRWRYTMLPKVEVPERTTRACAPAEAPIGPGPLVPAPPAQAPPTTVPTKPPTPVPGLPPPIPQVPAPPAIAPPELAPPAATPPGPAPPEQATLEPPILAPIASAPPESAVNLHGTTEGYCGDCEDSVWYCGEGDVSRGAIERGGVA
ncbi:unnamed protein product [Closterium sp. NIES-53]